jgi:hypothetical protein
VHVDHRVSTSDPSTNQVLNRIDVRLNPAATVRQKHSYAGEGWNERAFYPELHASRDIETLCDCVLFSWDHNGPERLGRCRHGTAVRRLLNCRAVVALLGMRPVGFTSYASTCCTLRVRRTYGSKESASGSYGRMGLGNTTTASSSPAKDGGLNGVLSCREATRIDDLSLGSRPDEDK